MAKTYKTPWFEQPVHLYGDFKANNINLCSYGLEKFLRQHFELDLNDIKKLRFEAVENPEGEWSRRRIDENWGLDFTINEEAKKVFKRRERFDLYVEYY